MAATMCVCWDDHRALVSIRIYSMAESINPSFHFPNGVHIMLQQGVIDGGHTNDIVVNHVFTNLSLVDNCSLAEYIREATLLDIQRECNAKAPNYLELGEYVVTNVGKGFENCFIYHLACWTEAGGNLDYQGYINLLNECFQAASDMNKYSIILPVIEIKGFDNHQDTTDYNLANLIITMCVSLAASADFTLRNVILHVSPKRNDLFEIYKKVLRQTHGNQTDKQTFAPTEEEVPTVAARFRNPPSISASVGPGGATDLTQWTTGSISQSVGRTGKGIKSEATLREQQDLGARPKVMNMASKRLDMSTIIAQNNEVGMFPGTTSGQNLNQALPAIKVYTGDITNVPAEVIVHGAYSIYNSVSLSGAVGKALVAAGGKHFCDACRKVGSTNEPNQFVVTTAGDMKYTMVFHINTSLCTTSYDWQKMILVCLDKANEKQLKSIAFPAFGTGTSYEKINELAENFKSAIELFKKHGSKNIEEIHIVLYDDNTCKMFKEILLGNKGDKDKTLAPVYPSRRTDSGTTSQAKSSSTNTRPPSGNTIHKCVINNGVTLQVIDEDITRHTADMIVNGTMSSVDGIVFIGQLGKAMETAGGSKFIEECRKQRVTPNSFVVTSGGSMPCFKVINVDIFSKPKTRSSKESEWKRIIWEILKEAEGLKMCSIAFPPLGLVGLEDAIVTDMVIYYKEVIDRFAAAQPKYLKDIRFVIYNDPALLMIFRDVLTGGNAPQVHTFEGAMAREKDEHRQLIIGGKIDELELVIVGGDLTKERTDAIVHATRNPIKFSGESGKALMKAGGTDFKNACSSAKYEPGNHTVFTSGGSLPCNMVLHLDMTYDDSIRDNTQAKLKLLTSRVYECLMAANSLQIHSLSFPALGTGKWGFKANDIAHCFEKAIQDFNQCRNTGHLIDIRLVVYDKTMLADFTERLLFV